MEYNTVFSPTSLGKLKLKNRLIMAPMSSEVGRPDGFINDESIDYYAARARGGFAVVTTEYIAVEDVGKAIFNQPLISDDKYIPGLKKLTDEIKKYGARAMIQLQHSGRQTGSYVTGQQAVAPSVTTCPVYLQPPRELTTDEVYRIINSFVLGAVRAQKAGFDLVELHAAHGYLLNQFLSPVMNKRLDEFGGGVDGRTYFLKLIIEGIKRECGADYPICVRCNTMEGIAGGYTENMVLIYAKMVEEFGADAFHITAGNAGAQQYSVPGSDYQPAWNLDVTKKLKQILTIPVITVGRYTDPQMMELALSNNFADIITIGRQSIADPDFPNKLLTKQYMVIVPCLSCNSRCGAFHDPRYEGIGDYGVSCAFNPFSPDRKELRIKPAEEKKSVMIIGAGPGGLEAAWVAAARGHQVSLYEKKPKNRAGGQLLTAAYPPYKQGLTGILRHYLYLCEKYEVNMTFEKEVDEAFISKQKPDVLIIATGGTPIIPNFKGADLIKAYQANDVLTGEAVASGKVLIIGGGEVGLETADFCTNYCTTVTVVEMLPNAGAGMNTGVLESMLDRFRLGGKVDIHTDTKLLELTPDGAVCECLGETVQLKHYSSVIYALGSKPFNPIDSSKKLAKEVYVIGDAQNVRSASEAFFEAAKLATSI
jgi:2,4-dienoyl-CoA reductase-like NADH-dependent reductase (Old Yellow Enzyme family)/thioredoxin reductase